MCRKILTGAICVPFSIEWTEAILTNNQAKLCVLIKVRKGKAKKKNVHLHEMYVISSVQRFFKNIS